MRPNKRKILQALNYLASFQGNKTISEMKAYKLLWLADRYYPDIGDCVAKEYAYYSSDTAQCKQ